MKKIATLLCIIALLAFTGCEKQNPEKDNPEEEPTWTVEPAEPQTSDAA